MGVLNVEMWNNHIRQVKDFSLTCETLEEKLKEMRYTGEKRVVDERVENLLLPPIALTFYSLIYDMGNVPTEDLLIEEYLGQEEYFGYLPDEKIEVTYNGVVTVVSMDGLISRILRTYPSLIRDFHFYLMSSECGLFEAVKYSFIDDYKNKIDLKIKYKEEWHNVGLLLGSKRSLFYRFKKRFRHKPVDVIYIELDKKDAHWVGDFMLYTRDHINELWRQIKHKQSKKI